MSRLDLDAPRFPQNTYMGRLRHFLRVTDPTTAFYPTKRLKAARELVHQYKRGEEPAGTTETALWKAQKLYKSAYHPETDELQFFPTRMSFQVPGNMIMVSGMITYATSFYGTILWQWINQTYNAGVNYANRSASAPLSTKRVAGAYISATGGAVAVSLALAKAARTASPVVGKLVPFVAVSSANAINIPIMRSAELSMGIDVMGKNGEVVGKSKKAARSAILQVLVSRIGIAIPSLVIPPVIMNQLEKTVLKTKPHLAMPVQVAVIGASLVVGVPFACAIFPQIASMKVSKLEPELRERLQKEDPSLKEVTFNKGL